MPREKETSFLKSSDYKIDGNNLRAFYDKHGKLVCVLDLTINKLKPNVLLVMTSFGDRKWDDVLSNEYGMDLELIRPKKDNKYQKLDVEYDGLVVYDNLIRAYQDGGNVKKAIQELESFRAMSVRRSASERLEASTVIAENARETIERTSDTIVELQAKIKAVKSKITSLRRGVGREPTKQSAAKILKAEAQLDVLTGKLERAKKRLENANKRLLIAEDDIEAARKVLDLVPDVKNKKFKTVETPVVAPVVTEDTSDDSDDETEDYVDEDNWADDESEDTDSDTEIKPLFDKDPEILDEQIAFKPISFDEKPVVESDVETKEIAQENPKVSEPVISFEPPKPIMDVVKVPDNYDEPGDVRLDDVFSENVNDEIKYDAEPVAENDEQVPMLDSLKSVNESTADDEDVLTDVMSSDNENTTSILEKDEVNPEIVASDVPENPLANTKMDSDLIAQPVVSPAPTDSSNNIVRPVAPVVPPRVVTDVPKPNNQQHKPSLLYYVLLLVLIALSVFTLWLYQRSNVSADAVPELSVETTQVAVQQQPEQPVLTPDTYVDEDENPFVASGDKVQTEEKPIVQELTEASLNKAAQMAELDNEPVTSDTDVDDVMPESDFVEEPEEAPVPTVVDKPEYKVTQENVFTGGSSDGGDNLCEGDVAPDANGCCPGETYSTVNGQQVCCPDAGGDCFPPLF